MSRARWFIRTTTGNFFFNYGASTPNADNRIYPWLRTTDGLWYTWNLSGGVWTAPRRFPLETTFGLIWVPPPGTPISALWSLDGGDGNDPNAMPPTDTTGAMWTVIGSTTMNPTGTFDGRVPVGVGTLQPSTTAVGVGDTGGVDEVTLTAAQVAKHMHPVNNADRPSGEGDIWVHIDPGGGDPSTDPHDVLAPSTTGGLATVINALEQTDGDAPHTNMPPYVTVYFIQPTVRKYYTVPG